MKNNIFSFCETFAVNWQYKILLHTKTHLASGRPTATNLICLSWNLILLNLPCSRYLSRRNLEGCWFDLDSFYLQFQMRCANNPGISYRWRKEECEMVSVNINQARSGPTFSGSRSFTSSAYISAWILLLLSFISSAVNPGKCCSAVHNVAPFRNLSNYIRLINKK
jgi:hypothetical protein